MALFFLIVTLFHLPLGDNVDAVFENEGPGPILH